MLKERTSEIKTLITYFQTLAGNSRLLETHRAPKRIKMSRVEFGIKVLPVGG